MQKFLSVIVATYGFNNDESNYNDFRHNSETLKSIIKIIKIIERIQDFVYVTARFVTLYNI